MKYYYERPQTWTMFSAMVHECDHPVYSKCTLYLKDGRGVAIVQKRFNKQSKMFWWGPIDPWLVDDISSQAGWSEWFDKNAEEPDDHIYPTFTIRKVMWALRMKPLPRESYEKSRKLQGL